MSPCFHEIFSNESKIFVLAHCVLRRNTLQSHVVLYLRISDLKGSDTCARL